MPPHHEASRKCNEQSNQEKQQPPSAGAEGVEPQRSEEREHQGFDPPPANFPAIPRPHESPIVGRQVPAIADRRREREERRHRQPGDEQSPERHASASRGSPPPQSPARTRVAELPLVQYSLAVYEDV